jgi:hypothetical protein
MGESKYIEKKSREEKMVEKEERRRTLLEKLGFAQLVFEFYLAPVE